MGRSPGVDPIMVHKTSKTWLCVYLPH
jgi:hypothetical protein